MNPSLDCNLLNGQDYESVGLPQECSISCTDFINVWLNLFLQALMKCLQNRYQLTKSWCWHLHEYTHIDAHIYMSHIAVVGKWVIPSTLPPLHIKSGISPWKVPSSINNTTTLHIAQGQNFRATLMPPSPVSPISKYSPKLVNSSVFMNLWFLLFSIIPLP